MILLLPASSNIEPITHHHGQKKLNVKVSTNMILILWNNFLQCSFCIQIHHLFYEHTYSMNYILYGWSTNPKVNCKPKVYNATNNFPRGGNLQGYPNPIF